MFLLPAIQWGQQLSSKSVSLPVSYHITFIVTVLTKKIFIYFVLYASRGHLSYAHWTKCIKAVIVNSKKTYVSMIMHTKRQNNVKLIIIRYMCLCVSFTEVLESANM